MSDVSADEVLVAKTDLQAGALRLPEVLMQSVTLVAPAIATLFSFGFIVGSFAGLMAPFAFAIVLLIALMLAINLSMLARAFPSAGGYFTYISRAIHPRVGMFAGWLYFLINPLVPGVILVETLAQCGGAGAKMVTGNPGLFFLASVEKVRFRRQVRPGDTLRMVIRNLRVTRNMLKQSGKAYVGEELAAEAEWLCIIGAAPA